MKSQIVEELGQAEVLLPSLIADGLRANDRVKVRLTVLQDAGRRVRVPAAPRFALTEECREVGLDPVAMDALVTRAGRAADDEVSAPGIGALGVGIWDDVETMARAVAAGDPEAGTTAERRLSAMRGRTALGNSDTLSEAEILALSSLSANGGDSLHRLVMDLHKDLNRLAAAHAEEVVAGAHAYGLKPEDRPTVEAFMRGVEATRPLKFDHPGLATISTRAGTRLTIQNDIGETDAHVVVIVVENDTVSVTYSDVHRPRAKFFVSCLDGFPAKWSDLDARRAEGLAEGGVFYLVSGRLTDADEGRRFAFLEALGASLVFLIDWNKARKVLRAWVPKADAVRILQWAARNRVGHRAFLELGGSDLVSAAVHHAAPTRIGFGERLDAVLGREAAVGFLQAVLRISAEALLDGSSLRLARDRIEADLVWRLERVDTALLAVVIRQAGLAREVAVAIAQHVDALASGREADGAALAARARRIEQKADRIALEVRGEVARLDADRGVERLADCIEEAIDELEQAAFIASLVPAGFDAALAELLVRLAHLAVAGSEAAAMGVAAAAEIPDGNRVDSEDALAAFGRLVEIEHEGDTAERAVTTRVLQGDYETRVALSALELARSLERASDQLARFGHLLHAHVLADLTR
ncbi:hypothetical protein V5F44_16520 [Xanthobacter sp. V2C-8]|uniref:hypothetical protein n=1 Tax=Xanthobacter albus TaxID=3119929 RepID=UPI003728F8ED